MSDILIFLSIRRQSLKNKYFEQEILEVSLLFREIIMYQTVFLSNFFAFNEVQSKLLQSVIKKAEWLKKYPV